MVLNFVPRIKEETTHILVFTGSGSTRSTGSFIETVFSWKSSDTFSLRSLASIFLILYEFLKNMHVRVIVLEFYCWVCFYVDFVQLPTHIWLFATPWTAPCQVSLLLTISWSLPKFMSIVSVMPSSHLILSCPLFLLSSILPSIQDFSNESAVCIRWPKFWSFTFSISPSNVYSGLISLMIDWFDLLADQRTFRRLLQHNSLKASILCCSAFFMVQVSQHYVPTGKTIALTIRTFVSRVMSQLFNTPSRFIIAFLPRSNHLISELQLPSIVII